MKFVVKILNKISMENSFQDALFCLLVYLLFLNTKYLIIMDKVFDCLLSLFSCHC